MKRVICLFPGSSELLSGLTAAGGTGFELVGTHHEDRHAPASCPRLTNDKPAEEEVGKADASNPTFRVLL